MKKWIVLICWAFAIQFAWAQNSAEEWKLLTARDGVEFYTMSVQSRLTASTSTLVKLRNTNGYEVVVTFKPEFACGDTLITDEAEEYFLEPYDASALQTYKVCEQGEPIVRIQELKVVRR